jgi:transcriptional regulator with XRE-family HTH domain
MSGPSARRGIGPSIGDVSANRLGEFLRAHRDAAQPADDDWPQHRRRTPGLRREEVAARAAISTDYYTRLEQGRERHPSAQVLDALAAALELSTAETSYLHGLVTPPATPRIKRTGTDEVQNEFLLLAMRSWTFGPAYIVNYRSDVLAANQPAQEIFEHFEISDNILRMLFLDPAAQKRMGRLGSVREVRRRHCPQNHRPSQRRRSGHHHFDLRAVRQEPSVHSAVGQPRDRRAKP